MKIHICALVIVINISGVLNKGAPIHLKITEPPNEYSEAPADTEGYIPSKYDLSPEFNNIIILKELFEDSTTFKTTEYDINNTETKTMAGPVANVTESNNGDDPLARMFKTAFRYVKHRTEYYVEELRRGIEQLIYIVKHYPKQITTTTTGAPIDINTVRRNGPVKRESFRSSVLNHDMALLQSILSK